MNTLTNHLNLHIHIHLIVRKLNICHTGYFTLKLTQNAHEKKCNIHFAIMLLRTWATWKIIGMFQAKAIFWNMLQEFDGVNVLENWPLRNSVGCEILHPKIFSSSNPLFGPWRYI